MLTIPNHLPYTVTHMAEGLSPLRISWHSKQETEYVICTKYVDHNKKTSFSL